MGAQGAQAGATGARGHPALRWGARIGLATDGIVYVVLAWLALDLAVGGGHGAQVSRHGALQQVGHQPLGEGLLWLAFAGFCGLALWEATTAVGGHRDRDGIGRLTGRLGSAGRSLVFAAFAVSSAEVALGSSGSRGTDSWTARLMRLPAGPVLLAAVGVGFVGYGCFSAFRGLSDRWREDLEPLPGRGGVGTAITVLARAGLTSRGVAFGAIGALLVWAALTEDPRRSGGLDQALQRLRTAPFGDVLLVLIALGLACYGAFEGARARYLRHQ